MWCVYINSNCRYEKICSEHFLVYLWNNSSVFGRGLCVYEDNVGDSGYGNLKKWIQNMYKNLAIKLRQNQKNLKFYRTLHPKLKMGLTMIFVIVMVSFNLIYVQICLLARPIYSSKHVFFFVSDIDHRSFKRTSNKYHWIYYI